MNRNSHPTLRRITLMLSVRVQGQEYRVSNETLDHLFGLNAWRQIDPSLLKVRVRDQHRAGNLIIDGRRLRPISTIEQAEQRLRREADLNEILRWGILYLAEELAELTNEVRLLRDAVQFDASALTEKLARDPGQDVEQELRQTAWARGSVTGTGEEENRSDQRDRDRGR